MYENDQNKSNRVLTIYSELLNGKILNKKDLAEKFHVNEKTIQRDLEDIRLFLDGQFVSEDIHNDLIYDYKYRGYRFEHIDKMKFTNDEILAICKILLDSRAFRKDDMKTILAKLLDCCVPKESQKIVTGLIGNEIYHYIPPTHNSHFLNKMWSIGTAIRDGLKIQFFYKGIQGKIGHERTVKPLAIMFSEYYFYLAAILENVNPKKQFENPDDINPTIYRIDRINGLKITSEHFLIPYKDRFEEGEFRKRIQFMFGGKLKRVKFEYTGYSLEAVLDRLPTAKIIRENNGKYIIQAEVFGDGIDMWLKSQGENVKII
ncbi:WYL domain-containing protein [Oribacterium sp. KHPX15]|uniref:helix-turn-helix transcriptional regulator n=1 Tax=Oribacterium sp. KHPX15 TaxID=1855342 RepID=UPI000899E053|nr:WYL domain-containing protein [Oribacterium sp. KHPX15]SEA29178.1 WYL domain-containing protein [Oribacterium sp. KHPX15]